MPSQGDTHLSVLVLKLLPRGVGELCQQSSLRGNWVPSARSGAYWLGDLNCSSWVSVPLSVKWNQSYPTHRVRPQ